MGFFDRLKEGLTKTRKGFIGKVESIFTGRKIDDETLEELEETLITSDIGLKATTEIVAFLREKARTGEIRDSHSNFLLFPFSSLRDFQYLLPI